MLGRPLPGEWAQLGHKGAGTGEMRAGCWPPALQVLTLSLTTATDPNPRSCALIRGHFPLHRPQRAQRARQTQRSQRAQRVQCACFTLRVLRTVPRPPPLTTSNPRHVSFLGTTAGGHSLFLHQQPSSTFSASSHLFLHTLRLLQPHRPLSLSLSSCGRQSPRCAVTRRCLFLLCRSSPLLPPRR